MINGRKKSNMDNFEKKIGLGAGLSALKQHKEDFIKLRDKCPLQLIYGNEAMNHLYPILDEDMRSMLTNSCISLINVYIAAIDNKFAELKAEFEKL